MVDPLRRPPSGPNSRPVIAGDRRIGSNSAGHRTIFDSIMGIVDAQEGAGPEPCHQLGDGRIEALEGIIRRKVFPHLGELVRFALEDRYDEQHIE